MDVSPDLDLSPRTGPGDGASPRRSASAGGRRWVGLVVLVVVLGLGAFAVSQALGDATLFFRNADEAVAQREELGDTRFRLQGLVVPGSTAEMPDGVEFEVTFNGVVVPVQHQGDPPELFQDDIPVVLEGAWSSTSDDAVFRSDRMLVKHDENYDAENPDRVVEAEQGGDQGADGYGDDPAGAPTP